ncbi:hypothetical protein ACHAWF_007242 [Thalassiosira exigua]
MRSLSLVALLQPAALRLSCRAAGGGCPSMLLPLPGGGGGGGGEEGRHRPTPPSAPLRRFPHPCPCRRPSSTALRASPAPQFRAGDEVLVLDDDGATRRTGVIERKRGGWYTVLLDPGSARVKRRGAGLQRRSRSTTSTDAAAAAESASVATDYGGSDSGRDDEALASPRPAGVLDLDRILRSARGRTAEDASSDELNDIAHAVAPETVRQIANCHSLCTKWVVYSDLHVMPSTLSTCLRVLDAVHGAARDADAGVLFLGDFWHHRGFVRVDCLNAVLEAMSTWTAPSIMIPGNHDQVDWKGLEHALTPLANAYRVRSRRRASEEEEDAAGGPTGLHPGPLIFSRPSKFLGATFVPHTRDKSTMEAILASDEVASSSALFVHADVKGASMNDLVRSEHGLSASTFPARKRVYSGHFHKPHEVRAGKDGASIRYVGSPYQTSFAEAGQEKRLLVVDSRRGWEVVREIPIDVGPRHHRVSSADRLVDASAAQFRRGDKVAVTVCQQVLEEMRAEGGASPFDDKMKRLREAGVSVELRDGQPKFGTEIRPQNNDTALELESLSPKATLSAYLDDEVQNGRLREATAKGLLHHGLVLLGQSTNASEASPSSKPPTSETSVTELEIESVSLLGFGSFRKEVTYPLTSRGVVLLRGTNDDIGSDSNGVGKSTLAMASLWALAGSTDPHPAQDGKVTDVVNDFSKIARVTLNGQINGKKFQITRTKSTSSKGSSLNFALNGADMTRQSAKDTQALINEQFSFTTSDMWMRTVFHGQHTFGGLLEASDAKLKDELSYLVSLDIWQQSASFARSQQRELMRKVSGLEGMLSLRDKDKKRSEEKRHAAKEEMRRRERMLEDERLILLQKEESLPVESDVSVIEVAMNEVQAKIDDSSCEVKGLEEELSKLVGSTGDNEIGLLRTRLTKQTAMEQDARSSLQASQRKRDSAMVELRSAESQLSLLQSEWNVDSTVEDVSSNISTPETCRTCGQPLISSTAQKHVVDRINEKLTAAISRVDQAREMLSAAERASSKANESLEAQHLEVQSCMEALRHAEEDLSQQTEGLRSMIQEARSLQSNLSTEFARLARAAKEISEFNLIKSQMQAKVTSLNEALEASAVAYDTCSSELDAIVSDIADLQKQKEFAMGSASIKASLSDVFGPKGIQAFVLRNIVESLEHCSQSFLDELSDGSLQLRMEVGPNDSIIKQAGIRDPDGTWRVRPLSSLSGGQWRRCSLALSLGFVDLASRRGRLRSSLLVLDEPLTHLDSAGRRSVGRLLRKMLRREVNPGGGRGIGLSTILVILQEIAAEEIEECFDQIDEVVKRGGESFVVLDDNHKK